MRLARRQRIEGSRTSGLTRAMTGFRPADADRTAANVDGGKYATRTGLHAGERNTARQPSPAYGTLRRVKGSLAPDFGLPLTRLRASARGRRTRELTEDS